MRAICRHLFGWLTLLLIVFGFFGTAFGLEPVLSGTRSTTSGFSRNDLDLARPRHLAAGEYARYPLPEVELRCKWVDDAESCTHYTYHPYTMPSMPVDEIVPKSLWTSIPGSSGVQGHKFYKHVSPKLGLISVFGILLLIFGLGYLLCSRQTSAFSPWNIGKKISCRLEKLVGKTLGHKERVKRT